MSKEEAKAITRPVPVDTEFAGMKAKKIVKSDGQIVISVNNEPYFDKLGIDDAVRKEVKTKIDELGKVVLKEMNDISLKNKCADVEVRLGQGAFSMEYDLQSKYQRGGVNPATKKPYEPHFGRVTARLNMPFGKEFKGDACILAEIEQAHEKAWAKMK